MNIFWNLVQYKLLGYSYFCFWTNCSRLVTFHSRCELSWASIDVVFELFFLPWLEWVSQIPIPLLRIQSRNCARVILANNEVTHHPIHFSIVIISHLLVEGGAKGISPTSCVAVIEWLSRVTRDGGQPLHETSSVVKTFGIVQKVNWLVP